MKKITIMVLLSLVFAFLFTSIVSADMPPEKGFHYIDNCILITNQSEFSDIVLIGYLRGPTTDINKGFLIEDGKCLQKGYKFSLPSVYWISKSDFKSINIENLKIKQEKIKQDSYYYDRYSPEGLNLLLDIGIYPLSVIKDNDHRIKEITEYSIVKLEDGSISLYKSKQISEYNNGTAPNVEIFDSPVKQNNQCSNLKEKECGYNPNCKGIYGPSVCTGEGKQMTCTADVVFKSCVQKEINKNSEPKKIENKNNSSTNMYPLQPAKKSFWKSFWCALGFSRNC